MQGEVGAVRGAKVGDRWHAVGGKGGAGGVGEAWAQYGGAVVGEADEALVEGGVPQRGEEEAVVDVEALLVGALGRA